MGKRFHFFLWNHRSRVSLRWIRFPQLCHRLTIWAPSVVMPIPKEPGKMGEKCRLPKFGYPMIPPSCCTPVQFVLELRVMPPWYESQILAFHSGDLPHPDCFNGGPPAGVLSGWWFWPLPNMVEKTSTNQACYITYTLYYIILLQVFPKW